MSLDEQVKKPNIKLTIRTIGNTNYSTSYKRIPMMHETRPGAFTADDYRGLPNYKRYQRATI